MKKTLIITTLALLLSGSFFAQNLASQRKINNFTEYVDRFNTNEIYHPENSDEYIGSPYHHDSYLLGNIYYNNELMQKNIALRYNVLADEIEYKTSIMDEDSKAQALVKSEDVFVTINGVIFVYITSKGYFEVIYDGINFSLIKKITVKYYPEKKPANNYDQGSPPTFTNKEALFIYSKEGAIYEFPKSKNKRLKVFGNSQAEVKAYIKKNKLNINNEKDLRKIVMYLDSVKGAIL